MTDERHDDAWNDRGDEAADDLAMTAATDVGDAATDAPRERRRRPRRTAVTTAPPPDPKGPLLLLVVAGIAVLLVALGTLVPRSTAADSGPGSVQPVDSSTVVCPEPGALQGQTTVSTVTVVSGLPGQDREGGATVSYLQGADDTSGTLEPPAIDLAQPGDSGEVVAAERRLPPLSVVTTGSLAPGLVAAETTTDLYDQYRGLASTACLGPDTTWWFLGGGSTAGRETNLILVNPESTPAELDVTIAGPKGEVATPALRGMVVEPYARVVVRMAREAPRLPFAAWHVNVRAGRVVAAVFDSEMAGYVPRGVDWVPPSADPSRRVYVPGVDPGPGGRQLLVYAPGTESGTVRVRFITSDGSFVPTGLPEFDVPAGSVSAIDLDKAAKGEAVTLELTSDVPIVAGVRERHPGLNASDYSLEEESFAGSATLITDVAAAAGLPAVKDVGTTLWITAPSTMRGDDGMVKENGTDDTAAEQPVTVTVRLLPNGGPEEKSFTVEVPRDRLVGVNLRKPDNVKWYTAVVTPSGGPIVISHRIVERNANGSFVTGYPWRPLRTTVVVPTAQQDAGLAVAQP